MFIELSKQQQNKDCERGSSSVNKNAVTMVFSWKSGAEMLKAKDLLEKLLFHD